MTKERIRKSKRNAVHKEEESLPLPGGMRRGEDSEDESCGENESLNKWIDNFCTR